MKVPVFDMGNVIVSVDMDSMYEKLVDEGLFSTEEDAQYFMKSIENLQNLGFTNVYDSIGLLGFGMGIGKEVCDYWKSNNVWYFNDKIISWIEKNIDHFPFMVLASNMGKDHYEEIMKNPILNHKKIIKCFSFQMGAVKPHYNYWRIFKEKVEKNVKRLGHDFCDYSFLYIDDREDYIDGWKAFWDDNWTPDEDVSVRAFQFNSTEQDHDILISILDDFKQNRF